MGGDKHFPNLPDPPAEPEFRAPNNLHNKASTVGSQAVLMENYSIGFSPLGEVLSTSMTYADNGGHADRGPDLHMFTLHTDGNIGHLTKKKHAGANWVCDTITPPSSSETIMDLDCRAASDGTLTLAVVTQDSSMHGVYVYYKKSYRNNYGVQSFFRVGWKSAYGNGIPTPPSTVSTARISIGLESAQPFYVCYDANNNGYSKVYMCKTPFVSVKWQTFNNLTAKNVYDVCATLGGVYTSFSGTDGSSKYVYYYAKDTDDNVRLSKGSNPITRLQLSLNPNRGWNDFAVYGVQPTSGGIWLYRRISGDVSSVKLPLSPSVADFCVTAQPDSDVEMVYAVNTKGDLYAITNHVDEFGTELRVATNASKVFGVSLVGSAYDNHADVVVLTKDADLMELQPTSSDSYTRVKVTVPLPVPQGTAGKSSFVTACMHNGLPNVFLVKTSNSHVHRYMKSEVSDVSQSRWELEEWEDGREAIALASGTCRGRGTVVRVSSDYGVWGVTLGAFEQWKFYGTIPGKPSHPKVCVGSVDDELVVLVMVTSGATAGAYQVDLKHDDFSHWKLLPANGDFASVVDMAIGRTDKGDGVFLCGISNDNGSEAKFYKLDSGSKLHRYGKVPVSQGTYTGVFVAPTGQNDVVFLTTSSSLYCARSADGFGTDMQIKTTYASPYHDAQGGLQVVAANTSNTCYRYQINASDASVVGTSRVGAMSPGAVALNNQCVYGRDKNTYPYEYAYIPQLSTFYGKKMSSKSHDTQAPHTFKSWVINYATMDLNGVSCPETPVFIQAAKDDTQVLVNGQIVSLNSTDAPLEIRSNARGVATITTIATSLHAPVFKIFTPYHPEDGMSMVEANGEEQVILANITQDELQQARKQDGSKLFNSTLPSDFADSVNETASMAMTSTADAESFNATLTCTGKSRSTVHRSVRRDAAHKVLGLNSERCKRTNTHIAYLTDAETGARGIKMLKGTREEVLAAHEARDQELAASSSSPPKVFEGTFGEIMVSTNDKLNEMLSITYVSTTDEEDALYAAQLGGVFDGVKKFLKAAVTFAVDTVQYVWNGVVGLAEDFMHAAQSLFTHVGVLFEDLFEWLGSVFKWSDILQNQRAMCAEVRNLLNELPSKVDWVVGAFQGAAKNANKGADITPPAMADEAMNRTVDAELEEANAETAANGYPGKSGVDESKTQYGSDPHSNWLMDLVIELLSRHTSIPDLLKQVAKVQEEIAAAAGCFMDLLETVAFAGKETLDRTVQVLIDRGTGVKFGDIIALVVGTLKGIAHDDKTQAALKGALAAFLGLLKSALGVFDTPINLPIVTGLFKSVTAIDGQEQELTLLNLVTLILSIPTTAVMRQYANVNGTEYVPLEPRQLPTGGANTRDDDSRYTPELSCSFGVVYGNCYMSMGVFDLLNMFSKELSAVAVGAQGTTFGVAAAMGAAVASDPVASFAGFAAGLLAQCFSCPNYDFGFPDSMTCREQAETVSWWWQFVFNITDVVNLFNLKFIPDPTEGVALTKLQKFKKVVDSGVPTSVFGFIHTAFLTWLAVADSEYMPDFGADVDWDSLTPEETAEKEAEIQDLQDRYKVSRRLKYAQNITTGVGEMAAVLRPLMADKVAATPQQVLAKLGFGTTYVLLAYEVPGILSLVRAVKDYKLADDAGVVHVVAN